MTQTSACVSLCVYSFVYVNRKNNNKLLITKQNVQRNWSRKTKTLPIYRNIALFDLSTNNAVFCLNNMKRLDDIVVICSLLFYSPSPQQTRKSVQIRKIIASLHRRTTSKCTKEKLKLTNGIPDWKRSNSNETNGIENSCDAKAYNLIDSDRVAVENKIYIRFVKKGNLNETNGMKDKANVNCGFEFVVFLFWLLVYKHQAATEKQSAKENRRCAREKWNKNIDLTRRIWEFREGWRGLRKRMDWNKENGKHSPFGQVCVCSAGWNQGMKPSFKFICTKIKTVKNDFLSFTNR